MKIIQYFISLYFLISIVIKVDAQIIYQEDFESNPDYISFHSEAQWLEDEGTYRVNTFDDELEKYWAHSPEFETLDSEVDFTIEFEMMTERGDFGTYPGIAFHNHTPESISNEGESIRIMFFWSSVHDHKFRFLTRNDSNDTWGIESETSYQDNTWYRFKITYTAENQTAEIEIYDKENGDLLETISEVPWSIQDIHYVCTGYYNTANWGNNWSPIQIDNITLTQEGPTSIKEQVKSSAIYPNPASHYLNIPDELVGQKAVITSSNGYQYIKTIQTSKLDLSNQPAGLYQLSIQGFKPYRFIKL